MKTLTIGEIKEMNCKYNVVGQTFSLGKIAYYGKRKVNEVEIDVRQGDSGYFSIVGNIWNAKRTDCVCCGQIKDALDWYKLFPKYKQFLDEIFYLWENYHLKDATEVADRIKNLNVIYKNCKGNE